MARGKGMIQQAPEPRGATRRDMRVPVVYWIVGKEDEKKETTTLDVSRTGLGIQLEALDGIKESAMLGMELDMHGDIIRAKGEVMIVKGQGADLHMAGVRFTEISDEDMSKLLTRLRLVTTPLEERIDKKQEQYFVGRLFQGNRQRYEETMKALSDIPTWEKASRKIDEMWAEYGIDRFSESSMDFTDIVYASMY